MLKFTSYLKSAAALALIACSGVFARRADAQTFGTVLNTNLFQPSSVSVSPLNHYVISDTADHRIVDFNADNRQFAVLAGPDTAPFDAGAVDGQGIDARFRNPQGVLCAGHLIYVADSGNHVIRRIDKTGNVVTIAGDISAAHEVDDFGGSPSNFGYADGTGVNAKFNGPAGLAWDGADNLYIADSGNHAIRVLNLTNGTVSTVVRSGLTTPVGVALGLNGTLFISDTGAHSIKVWHPGDTKATLLAGGGSQLARGFRNSAIATNALFNAPAGIFYREVTDELIVADSGNSALRTIEGASGAAAKVDTFANTTAAGFKSPIAVTRDIYGVFLVCDPTRNTLASVLTVRFPRIDKPQVGYIEIIIDPQTQLTEARLVPVADMTFENFVDIAISGDASAQHYFTVSSTLTNTPDLAAPTTNSTSAPNFVQPVEPAPSENTLKASSINGVYPPKYNFHLKILSAPKGEDERIASLVTEAYFRFKCASPQIDSQSIPGRLVFHCNTTNAVMYYTLDGSDPEPGADSSHIVQNDGSISLVVTTSNVTVRVRAYKDSFFIPSDVTQVTFTPDNFVPNRIALGFPDGEASSYMRAAAGQRFFAPVTLSLMPGAKAYGLQFDLSLEPISAPPLTSDYKMRFNSSFIEQTDFTNYTIPPAVYVLTGTNYVTNFVNDISTNYTYEATFTNISSVPSTNYLVLTNKLQDTVPVLTTTFATNLGTIYPIFSTNYVTNSFQYVSTDTLTNISTEIDTNYLYRYLSPTVTNFVRVDAQLQPSTPVIVTNFVSNLGQLYSYNVTNYITNSFNLVSSGNVTNVIVTVTTNYAYQAVSPAITNYLSLSQSVPADADVIVTNFVSNLGQQFPITTTNHLTNSFAFISSSLSTNTATSVETLYQYRAVTPGVTNLIVLDHGLPDSTPVILTNFVTNLGQIFPVLTTNSIANDFNLLSAGVVTNKTRTVQTNYVYEAGTPSQTNIVVLDHPLKDTTEIITTNFVSNLGQQFPVLSTNRITNAFNLLSAGYTTNVATDFTTNYLYAFVTPALTNVVQTDHHLDDSVPVVTTNLISNLGEQFPVLTTNYINNSFNLFSIRVLTNTLVGITTNFDYRAVIPGGTNFITANAKLPDSTAIVLTNFVTNMGQLYPVTTTNYISNAFNLVSLKVQTNSAIGTLTNYVYAVNTPGQTNVILTDHRLDDRTPIVTTNLVSNLGQQFPVLTTNYISNSFNLVAEQVVTNVDRTVTTNFAYRTVTPGKTNLITVNALLQGVVPVITTNFVSNLGQQFPIAQTNYLTNGFDLVSLSMTTNVVSNVSTSNVYRFVSNDTNYVTIDHFFPDTGPVVTFITATNLGRIYVLTETNIAQNVFELVSATISTNVVNKLSYDYSYPDIFWTNDLRWPDPLPADATIVMTNTIIITNLTTGVASGFPIVTSNSLANATAQLVLVDGQIQYDYQIPTTLHSNTLFSATPLVFPSQIAVQDNGFIPEINQTYTEQYVTIVTNGIIATNTVTNTVYTVQISTNATYRFRSPLQTNYITLSTNLPDIAPVVSEVTITNQGQNFTMVATNYVSNRFDLVSTTYATNTVASVLTNAVYALRTPSLTNIINLSTNLPDTAAIVTTSFVTNLGQLFPVTTTNYVANTFEFLGATRTTNTQTTVRTNVTYALIDPPVTNYVLWPDLLPPTEVVLTTNFVSNLGRLFPVIVTNYVTNSFQLAGSVVQTNFATGLTTNALYAFTTPSVTNYLSLTNKLLDLAPVVTTTFLTNQGQLFPINSTNYVANSFDFLGEEHLTNVQRSVSTNFTYVFLQTAVTNYIFWPELLPPVAPLVVTNFVNNLGRQFPVLQTNYFTNQFQLVSSGFVTTNQIVSVSTNIVYAFTTQGSANYIAWPTRLPDVAPVITTNFVSNLGELFPVTVTNYLTNTFRLVADAYTTTNETSTVATEFVYRFSTPDTTNYISLTEKLPSSRAIITTNFISNLGQQYPVLTTNVVLNTFELLSTNFFTNVTSTVSSNLIYALKTPSVTNIVMWPVKLPDSVAIVSTNFITNLGTLFPVLSTNIVANQFQLLFTNYETNIALNVQSNVLYEFHTPGVTNLFDLDEKLPDLVQVITTNFVTNLGRLFPVMSTNISANLFDLLSTNISTNTTVTISTNYTYAVVTPGTGANGQFTVVTNLLSMDSQLPSVTPVVTRVGFATNLSELYPIYSTNYVTNTFKLVSTTFMTNRVSISETNVPDRFTSLVITNYSQNWLAVGWVETYGRTNLYNSIQHDLLNLSMPNITTFQSKHGEAVPGSFSFILPTNAIVGDQYKVAITRPSATADGISQDMFIEAPGDEDPKSPVKAVKTLTVTNQVGYLVGDVGEFRWFNAGEFGDTNLVNNDLTVLQRVIIYGLNVPPEDSDYLDAMDTCCFTEDGVDLSNIEFGSSAIDLNRIAFGEGSRYAPLGRRPNATLAVNDLYVAFRRSLDPDLSWYYRYWSNGMRQARIIPNAYRGQTSGTTASASQIKALSIPSGSTSQSTTPPALTVYAGTATGMPGNVVAVPIHARIDGSYPLRTLMFNAHVEAADGTLIPGSSLDIKATDALGVPRYLLTEDPARAGAAWLDTTITGILGDQVVGQLLFTIPQNAQPSSLFYVKLERISGSPNGVSLFPVRSGNGIIAMANRGTLVWNDGIPDAWRLQYFGTLNDPRSAADADADGDGLSNYEEYKLGTNPLDPSDSLRVHAASNGRGVKIRFHTANGKMYRIEGSTNLEPGAWTTVLTDVAGTGNDIELPAPGGAHSYYYRVLLQE